jgi:hypothetical protein
MLPEYIREEIERRRKEHLDSYFDNRKIKSVPLSPSDLEKLGLLKKKSREDIEKFNQDLRSKAKTQDELIVPLECKVESALKFSDKTYLLDKKLENNEIQINCDVKYENGVTLLVSNNEKVKRVMFSQWPNLQKDDLIRIYVYKGEEISEKNYPNTPFNLTESIPPKDLPTHYIERNWQETEKPILIEKLVDGEVVDTYFNNNTEVLWL